MYKRQVVPEVASRRHIETIDAVIDEALEEANVTFDDIDAIAVTYGPGLVGALLVGVSTAKALAFALNKPLVPVHHIKGHIMANFVAHKDLEPPFVCLVASGGHSHIVSVEDYTHLEIMGRTRDDAAGEAFDKIARVLGLGYPGGPLIDKLAKEGNPKAVDFPRVRMDKNSLDFSFSGVKTAVINYLHKLEQNGEEYNKADIAACLLYTSFKGLMQIPQINASKAEVAKLTNQIEYEQERQKEIEELKGKVNTDEYIEKMASEKLGLIKSNAKVFVDVSGEQQ